MIIQSTKTTYKKYLGLNLNLRFNLVLYSLFGYSTKEHPKISGLTYSKSACKQNKGVFIGLKSPSLSLLSSVTAHEIGHTIGMVHDESYPKGMCL